MNIDSNHKCCISPNCELEIESERQTGSNLGLFISGELECAPSGDGWDRISGVGSVGCGKWDGMWDWISGAGSVGQDQWGESVGWDWWDGIWDWISGQDGMSCVSGWWPWMHTEDEHWGQAVLHAGKRWKPIVFPVQLFYQSIW